MTPEQIAIYRAMSPRRKLEIAAAMNRAARELKAAGLRMQHPDWSADDIRREVRRIFLYASN